MEQLPLLAAACERGEIAPSKIREISRVATRKTEQQWLDIARKSTCRQIEKLVPLTPRGGLPPAPFDGDTPPYRITLHSVPGSPVAWIEGASGPHYVPSTTCEEAFCDGEILDVREVPGPETTASCPTGDHTTKDPARHGPRIRRTIPLTLRRKVLERDGRMCTAPGCSHRSFLSLHHIEPVEHGGREHNLTTVCYRCHRALHTGKLSVSGRAPEKLVWRNRQGIDLKGSS